MKKNQLLACMLLVGGIIITNGQNVASTANLTSGGNTAGSTGTQAAYYGYSAGKVSTGSADTFIGAEAGRSNTTGINNTFVGYDAGRLNVTGNSNTYIGSSAGRASSSAGGNIFVGASAGSQNSGSQNIIIGTAAVGGSGSGNIFLGCSVTTYLSNKLVIDNTATATPLIHGDFALDQLKINGQLGIGNSATFPTSVGGANTSAYKLFVKGGILADEVRVATTWADYVFEDSYALPSLDEVECFINDNGHLPNVPSAKQVAEEGISVGEMAKIQQEKIEELTLYIIAQDKQLKEQQLKIEKLEKQEKEITDLKVIVQGFIDRK